MNMTHNSIPQENTLENDIIKYKSDEFRNYHLMEKLN
jgi:hypothetical protein